MANYVFIVCNPRSGSTLTRNILNQWDSVSVSPELEFLYRIASQRQKFLPLEDPSNREALTDRLFRKLQKFDVIRDYRELSEKDEPLDRIAETKRERFATFKESQPELTVKMIYEWFIREFSNGSGPTFVVKKPANLYMLPLIDEWFPGARVLGLVRDPRDTVVSMTKGDRHGLNAFWKAPCLWSFNARRLLTYRDDRPSTRIRIQRFEDLIRHPERTLREMCEFLDLEFLPERARDPDHVNSAFEEDSRGFNEAVIGRYRTKLSEREIDLVETICRQEMDELGYDLSRPVGASTPSNRGRRLIARFKKRYMSAKESLRSAFKNQGRYHWLTPLFDT